MTASLIRKFFNCSYLDEISLESLFLRSRVPSYQKSLANNYTTIKRIFSYTVVQPRVTNIEYNLLEDNGFLPLESTDEEKMYDELIKLLDWSDSFDIHLAEIAKKIFEIRVKELRYIIANVSAAKLVELNGGYLILERYLDFISG